MILEWFNAREAAKIGAALADQFAPRQVMNSTARGMQPWLRELTPRRSPFIRI
jgi:hypothetical protein